MIKTFSLIGLFIYFFIILFIVIKDKKNKTVIEYFFAGRSLPFWTLSISFIASWWGAGSSLSTADLAYKDGLGAFWYYGVPVLISAFIMIFAAPFIRKIGFFTQSGFMEKRYDKTAGKLMGIMIVFFMTFAAASQMVGIGDFFGAFLGLNYEIAVLLGSSVVLAYSVFGGFRGVVLTDIIQFVLLLISAILVFAFALKNAGGFEAIKLASLTQGKSEYFNIFAGANKYFVYVITFGLSWAIQANVWQRISATKNSLDAKKMAIMSFLAYIPLYLIVVFTGMAGIVLFESLPQGGVVSGVVLNYMPPILAVVVIVGITAAIMSTMDSLINTAAMSISLDLLANSDKRTQKQQLLISKIATFAVTLIAIVISLKIRSILEISWIASDIITTGAFVPLVMGMLWKRGNAKAAISSMSFGFLYCLYNLAIGFGVNLPSCWAYQSTKQVIIGIGISFLLYTFISLLGKRNALNLCKFKEQKSLSTR